MKFAVNLLKKINKSINWQKCEWLETKLIVCVKFGDQISTFVFLLLSNFLINMDFNFWTFSVFTFHRPSVFFCRHRLGIRLTISSNLYCKSNQRKIKERKEKKKREEKFHNYKFHFRCGLGSSSFTKESRIEGFDASCSLWLRSSLYNLDMSGPLDRFARPCEYFEFDFFFSFSICLSEVFWIAYFLKPEFMCWLIIVIEMNSLLMDYVTRFIWILNLFARCEWAEFSWGDIPKILIWN